MKKIIAPFLALAFVAGPAYAACDQSALANAPASPVISPPLVPGTPALKLAYHAIFTGGTSSCFLDRIHTPPQAPQEGDGQVPGQTRTFTPTSRGLVIGLTAPKPIPPIAGHAPDDTQTPSAGVFATGLNYGPGTFFSTRATFVAPRGLFDGAAWAVTLNARTGGSNDLGSEARLNVTLKFKKGTASLNAYDGGTKANSTDIPKDVYTSIVSSLQPFTMEMMVSRKTGRGAAVLTTAGSAPVMLQFALTNFGKKSGPVVQAVGPAIATCCLEAVPLSVELTDFQILEQPSTPSPD